MLSSVVDYYHKFLTSGTAVWFNIEYWVVKVTGTRGRVRVAYTNERLLAELAVFTVH